MESENPYKWSKINGFHMVSLGLYIYIYTPTSRSYNIFHTTFFPIGKKGPHLVKPQDSQHAPFPHTPWIAFHPQMKGIPNHKLLVGGRFGMFQGIPGVCWRFLRGWANKFWNPHHPYIWRYATPSSPGKLLEQRSRTLLTFHWILIG